MPLPRPPEPETDPEAVREQWEAIGPAFDETRRYPWDAVVDWAVDAFPGLGWSLDLGCGNGRHGRALAQRGHRVVGVDVARSLAEAGRDRWRAEAEGTADGAGRFEAVQGDARDLPLPGDAFEGGLFVAAVHNIPSRSGRVGALAELRRVLSPGAPALVTAWALWQDRWLPTVLRELPRALLGGPDPADRAVAWKRGEETVDRTYHLYRRRELAEDLRAAGFVDVEVEGVRLTDTRLPDNWFGTARAP